ncbi:MAG: thiamine pyrophosphate-dependent enzyme [Sphingomonadales bacterium]|nr:thiamine pyrophosphate-dependent enzyme [Sphingomonadales bacterium]
MTVWGRFDPEENPVVSTGQKIGQGEGDPREPVAAPLSNAQALGIRQVIDQDGKPTGNLPDPGLSKDDCLMFYRVMTLLRAIDQRGWTLQRSGRIAFWIPICGQEAVQVGATHAMDREDWIFRAHREMAPWIMRGEPLDLMFAQFFGAEAEPQRGRRLPCLIGSRKIKLVSSSTQVGAYIPHGAGAGWAAKLMGSDEVVLSFFGDGATSRGEFHSAMNFAGIHKPQVVFVCVNNGWAVTTPLDRQTAQEDFAAKGAAYGLPNLRVDGNDPLAVYAVVKEARDRAKAEGPTLIEAITYRLGFHTSSDNPDLYRKKDECDDWARWDPIVRMRRYLEHAGWWTEADEAELAERQAAEIQDAVERAEKMPVPGPTSQFDDLYEDSNWMLEEQKARLLRDLGDGA